MSLLGPVNAVNKLCRHEVAQVLHAVRCGVDIIVATFSVGAEAVSVFHPQIQTLSTKKDLLSKFKILFQPSRSAASVYFTYWISGYKH